MDADDAARNVDIGHGRVLADHLSTEDPSIKRNGAGGVRSPDDVFESFDVHGRELTDVSHSGNEEMVFVPQPKKYCAQRLGSFDAALDARAKL